jgi:hypothetical protein
MMMISQALEVIRAVYAAGCLITVILLLFRRLNHAVSWEEVYKVCSATRLPKAWTGVLVAVVLAPIVILWPLVAVWEYRRWRRARRVWP